MVRVSYDQKPYRRIMMEAWGGKCVPSPSPDTNIGRKMLAEDPNCPGSLGLAISEAVEDTMSREDTHYSLGSVLNHVLLHQTVNGLEAKKLMEEVGEYPDIIIGCAGGGSNAAGMYLPFVKDKIEGTRPNLRVINVEPYSCPTMTKGPYAYDYGDTAKMAPIVKMYTLGHGYMPPPIHAGGLRYHGMAPIISHLLKLGYVERVRCTSLKLSRWHHLRALRGILSAPRRCTPSAPSSTRRLRARRAARPRPSCSTTAPWSRRHERVRRVPPASCRTTSTPRRRSNRASWNFQRSAWRPSRHASAG
jgi:pyridoxal-phosphate dependent TrpB-like enzyme